MLVLNDTKIADAGLKEMTKLPFLTSLGLYECTKITDAALKEVAKFQQLTVLILPDQITDAGLKEVAKLNQLKDLHLYTTKVTKVGVAELQSALPECKITHNAKR